MYRKRILVMFAATLLLMPAAMAYDYLGYGIIPYSNTFHPYQHFTALGLGFETARQAEIYIASTGNPQFYDYDVNKNRHIDEVEYSRVVVDWLSGDLTNEQYYPLRFNHDEWTIWGR